MNKNDKPKTIEEYIESAPETAQLRLREMLKCLRNAAPNAKEAIKWGSPALSYNTILFIFAAYKKHVSLFPTPPGDRSLLKRTQRIQNVKQHHPVPIGQTSPN